MQQRRERAEKILDTQRYAWWSRGGNPPLLHLCVSSDLNSTLYRTPAKSLESIVLQEEKEIVYSTRIECEA